MPVSRILHILTLTFIYFLGFISLFNGKDGVLLSNRSVTTKIKGILFLQFFAMGVFTPVISLYLKDYLHFSGSQIGIILATSSVSAFISPLLGSFIADRIIPAERLYSICHILAAAALMLLSTATEFFPFFFLFFLFMTLFGPTVPLANTITFHHISDKQKNFGFTRVWGTIGWIVSGVVFGMLWLKTGVPGVESERLPDFIKITAGTCMLLGFFAFSLPESGANKEKNVSIIPIDSIKVFFKREIWHLSIYAFILFIFLQYYNFWMSPYLKTSGFSESDIMPLLTLGQASEILTMMLLGFFLKKYGFKKVFAAGMVFEIIRYALLIAMDSKLVFLAIIFHGPAYTFIFANAYIFLDSRSTKKSRAGVMQLYAIITGGFAKLIGTYSSGAFTDIFCTNGVINYTLFWSIPLIVISIALIAFLVFFSYKDIDKRVEPVSPEI